MKYFALIDPGLSPGAVNKLKKFDIEPVRVPATGLVDSPVAGHPDLQVFLNNGNAFVHPGIDRNFIRKISQFCNVTFGSTKLTRTYPGDIAYNIAVTGDTAFHLKNETDPVIKEYFVTNGITLAHVKQGYTKCSTLIVDDKSIITADKSINETAIKNGFASLLITPGYVNLPGYKYGFLGGASGRFRNMIFFTGNIDSHPDRERIYSFINDRGLTVELLSDEPAYDAGSLLISSY
ncbi:MAG TPA: hypothetical protein PK358_05090 [Spirochaetota bacterium]|nr:hypothetical protein [Spirochaetota bacterium]HPJ34189.1 hypothetical protein [Spirochaetota bacterium]